MPDVVQMRVGETRQLRVPPGEVEHWSSSAPAIVTTTDEDITSGRAGGLITACRTGFARIIAVGFDKACLLELDVEIVGLATVQVETAGTAPMPVIPGVAGWSLANSHVAQLTEDGRVRGMSPGITSARGTGSVPAECLIEVTGTLIAEINQTVPLSESFAIPVRTWRTSTSEVSIDSQGLVATGDRPRTVEISAELDGGRVFTFDLRVTRPSTGVSRTPERSQSGTEPVSVSGPLSAMPLRSDGVAALRGFPPPGGQVSGVAPPGQRQEMEQHLTLAERHNTEGNWIQAGAEITAARISAMGDPDLLQRVDQINERLYRVVVERAGTMLATLVQAIVEGRFADGRRNSAEMHFPPIATPVVEGISRLTSGAEHAVLAEGSREEVQRQVLAVWRESVRLGFYATLPPLADVGLQNGEQILTALIETLCSPVLSDMPIAIRQALEAAVAETGDLGIAAVVSKFTDASTSPALVKRLLELLPGLKLQRHAAVIVKVYAQSNVEVRSRLVACFAGLRENAATALLDLLAGTVNRLPLDVRFAQAVQKQVGAKVLEQLAGRWAAGGHRGAQVVLQRLYEYPASAFAK